MGAKLEKIGAELEKARAKRAALDIKIKNLEQKYQEEYGDPRYGSCSKSDAGSVGRVAPYGSEGCTESADAHGNSEGG